MLDQANRYARRKPVVPDPGNPWPRTIPLRQRCRLRAAHGTWSRLPATSARLARAEAGIALDRYRVRQRRLLGADRRTTVRLPRTGIDPSEGQLRHSRARGQLRASRIPARRRHGASVRRCKLRRCRDGARHLLRARSYEGASRNVCMLLRSAARWRPMRGTCSAADFRLELILRGAAPNERSAAEGAKRDASRTETAHLAGPRRAQPTSTCA